VLTDGERGVPHSHTGSSVEPAAHGCNGHSTPVCVPDSRMLHRLTFDRMYAYQQDAFFPAATLEFCTEPGRHYHVPLTWSGFGYSTYRGS